MSTITMRTFNPQLAELMEEIDKTPTISTLRTFADIVNAMRGTHDFLMVARNKFERIYSDAVKGGKYTTAGLRDMKEDFEDAYKSVAKKFTDILLSEIDKWKSKEQRNTFDVVSKAPTDEQAKILNVVLKRESISQAEIEMWAKHFSDNYVCSCSFRDYAKNKGYIVVYSDFTDAEERIETVEKAYNYLKDLIHSINTTDENLSYPHLVFYGKSDETGEHFANTFVDDYIRILDSDTTFKSQTIEVKPITEDKAS